MQNLLDRFRDEGETRNVDFKARMSWPARDQEEQLGLLKDAMAMANTPDGGFIVIGVENRTRQMQPLTDAEAATWDPTVISQALARYASPVPIIHVLKAVQQAGSVLILTVDEFDRVPVVCRQSSPLIRRGGRPPYSILRQGSLYIRTFAAQTVEISNEQEMRVLLERARLKAGSDLLRQIQDLIAAQGVPTLPAPDPYDETIAESLQDMGSP